MKNNEDIDSKKYVSRDAYEQIRWERDLAIQQLEDLGYGLGEKPKNDDDRISRQEAIRAIAGYQGGAVDKSVAKRLIMQLPSIGVPKHTKDCDESDIDCDECEHHRYVAWCDKAIRDKSVNFEYETGFMDGVDAGYRSAKDELGIVLCKDCKYRGENECPRYEEQWVEYDDDGYLDEELYIVNNTVDDGFCERGEYDEGD